MNRKAKQRLPRRSRVTRKLLKQIKELLQEAHGERLEGLILYGSEARGEAAPDSDIDLLVLLKGPIDLWDDIHANVSALYNLDIQNYRPISALPVDVADFEAGHYPLYREALRDGIRL